MGLLRLSRRDRGLSLQGKESRRETLSPEELALQNVCTRYAEDWDDESYSQEQFEADVERILEGKVPPDLHEFPRYVTQGLMTVDTVLKELYMPPIASLERPAWHPRIERPAWVREAEEAQLARLVAQ